MERKNEVEIDLVDLFYYLKKKIWIIAAACLLCAMIGGLVTAQFLEAEYTAATRMYVLNRSSEDSISTGDYSVSNYMIKDYEILITGRNVTQKVIERLQLTMSPAELSQKISVEAVGNTRVLQITVVDNDPNRAAQIANCVREVASTQIKDIMNAEAVNLVYEAEVPGQKSGPSVSKNIFLAAGLGLIVAIGVLITIYIVDDTIRTEEDVERYLGLSVLGVIPQSSELANLANNAGTSGKSAKKTMVRLQFMKNREVRLWKELK